MGMESRPVLIKARGRIVRIFGVNLAHALIKGNACVLNQTSGGGMYNEKYYKECIGGVSFGAQVFSVTISLHVWG